MSIRKKLATGAALAAIPVLTFASPVGADAAASASTTVTFQHNGQEITCTVTGTSTVRWLEDTNQTRIDAQSGIAGDSQCFNSGIFFDTTTTIQYRKEGDQRPQQAWSSNGGPFDSVTTIVNGAVTDVGTFHSWRYSCDESEPGGHCTVSVQTNPK